MARKFIFGTSTMFLLRKPASHAQMLVSVPATPVLLQLPANEHLWEAALDAQVPGPLLPAWEIHMEFQAPGPGLAQV